jgi:hypothetical protein
MADFSSTLEEAREVVGAERNAEHPLQRIDQQPPSEPTVEEKEKEIDQRLYEAKLVRFDPGSKGTPTKLREGGTDLKVTAVNKVTGVVKYSAPRDPKPHSTHVKHLVLSPKDKLAVNRSDYKNMTERYSLKDNDIFCTPDEVFAFMSAMYGFDVKAAFDPAPAKIVPWDGLKIDWPLDEPVFVNPPFSKIFTDWLDKVCAQVSRGVDAIMLISSDCYYTVEGVDRCQKWEDTFAKYHIEVASHDGRSTGCIYKWLRWGVNMLTGDDTGGPRNGVVIFRMSNGPPGESIKFVTPEAAQVIKNYKDSKARKRKDSKASPPPFNLPPTPTPIEGTFKIDPQAKIAELTADLKDLKLAEVTDVDDDDDDDAVSDSTSEGTNWNEWKGVRNWLDASQEDQAAQPEPEPEPEPEQEQDLFALLVEEDRVWERSDPEAIFGGAVEREQ